jgi:uncharacterized protein YfaS (alpha-2-macroglobulin family)
MPLRFRFLLAGLMLIATGLVLKSFQSPQQHGDGVSAIYSHGNLHVAIPYQAPRPGAGRLSIDVLDPDDAVLAHAERNLDVTDQKGLWQEDLKLAKALPVDDVVWHRVRYRFVYKDGQDTGVEGTDSISEILRTPVVRVLGQQSYLAGGPAAVRLIVTDSKNEPIPGVSTARIELLIADQKPRLLFTGNVNSRGTTEAQFRFPPSLAGSGSLHYVVDTAIGSTEVTQPVRIEDKVSILLTTEKPLYQPGQTIHVRSVALNRATHEASASRGLTFEVEDSRGNKVFKKATQTDKFGVASAEFALADEVNLGTYHLRALMDDGNTAEIAMNVERYVLPKFKVAVELTGKNQHGYRPGDHVTGVVRANYFFGKPVDNSSVTLKLSAMDVVLFDAGKADGKTNNDGEYHFDIPLPTYFAGRPLSQGAARVLVEASVKDNAGHSESRGEPITVSETPLIITAVPEGGTLIPNLENQAFVLASYADGKPAVADVRIHADGMPDQNVTTDAGGVAVVRVKTPVLRIEAADKDGNKASSTVTLNSRGGDDQILLRTEHAVYKAGDRIQLHVFATKQRGTAYVDVVKEGQTILTRDLDIVNGQAELSLTATGDLAGTLDVNAYMFGASAIPAGDHRLVFVQPADELKIEATSDAPVYKPGDDARIRFRVTNSRGEGVQAALGLQVVDEAVFALAEKQPGFAKVFFYLEQEALKPRYEIHSIGMPEIVEPVAAAQANQRDRAARALFAATEVVAKNKFETEAGRSVPSTKFVDYGTRYQVRFIDALRRESGRLNLTDLDRQQLRDPWNNAVQVSRSRWAPQTSYVIRSAGPDKRFDTADDMAAYMEVQNRKTVGRPSSGPSAIDLNVEHDIGPFNGRAQLVGTVIDQAGHAVEQVIVTARETSTGKARNATTNAEGRFAFAGLTSGDYELLISTPAETVSKRITLEERDRAVVSAFLRHQPAGSVSLAATVREFDRLEQFAALRKDGGVLKAGVVAGFAGGGVGGARMFDAPASAPMKMMAEMRAVNSVTVARDQKAEPAEPRVRSYFPEALYINPEIITDANGAASISIPIADSITTWRMAMIASTTHGALGTGTSSLKVFQDFFVDLDLPVTLTQGDHVSIPIAAYNYSGASGDVSLHLEAADWFALSNDTPDKIVAVETGRVGGSQFSIEAKRIGKFKLTLMARMKGRADIVVREIEVIPNGREQTNVFNGRLESSVQHNVSFPGNAIPDASKVFVRLYPGPLSQVIEGMDAILRMPGGCFEQTSSSTYPNVLALDYMKRTKKLTPEVHAKAEGFIANGYQRLLTFEVPGGGFSWFGQAPANKILTSYGLMEFADMAKVHDVDPKLIQRTQQWLASQQQGDGSWKPDTSFINEGATNRYNTDVLRITAYIAWALENTGYQGPAVDKARQYVDSHLNAKFDTYTLAVLANFAADGKDRDFTRRAMELLLDARTEKDEQAWWKSDETSVYASGESAKVETTGLAAQALLKWGQASPTARKAMTYIASKKDASGTWGTTQATIMALRALLLATEKGTADVQGKLEVSLNGQPIQTLALTAANNDLLHRFVIKAADLKQANSISIRFEGKGSLAYQVVGDYFVPWQEKPAAELLSIGINYDRTKLSQDDVATATATVKNNLGKVANMVMVDLGIPPGFDLLSEDLQTYQEQSTAKKSGRLEKFTQTATQAILYFDSIAPGDTVTLHYRLRAKYPIRARTLQSRVYEYYDPAVGSIAKPADLEIKKR